MPGLGDDFPTASCVRRKRRPTPWKSLLPFQSWNLGTLIGVGTVQSSRSSIARTNCSARLAGKASRAPEGLSQNHAFFQFYVAPPTAPGGRGTLSCQLYQRSADIFLGVPFNIASYALLTHMLAQQCDLDVGEFIWTGGDCHIYSNHREQVELQLSRTPHPYPTLRIKRRPPSIFDYELDDFEILDYQHHPVIKAPVAV